MEEIAVCVCALCTCISFVCLELQLLWQHISCAMLGTHSNDLPAAPTPTSAHTHALKRTGWKNTHTSQQRHHNNKEKIHSNLSEIRWKFVLHHIFCLIVEQLMLMIFNKKLPLRKWKRLCDAKQNTLGPGYFTCILFFVVSSPLHMF